jgi:hypothetical protein
MESLIKLIEVHYLTDKSRNSFSNLIKKIKLENEFFNFIENYISFGTFKQKLYHFINRITNKIYCSICNTNKLKWVEKDNRYRTTCSINCAGKLTGKKNNPKRKKHPNLNSKDEFIDYFNKNKIKLVESSLSKIYPKLVESINNTVKFDSIFPEKVYFYLNDLKSRPICNHCNYNTVSFDTFSKGYHNFCSIKCSSNSDEKKNKIKETCIYKYGVENIGMITREKALLTMVEKYGAHIATTDVYKEKYKNTCLQKYGEEHIFKTEDFKTKMKKLFLVRYGDISPMRNKDIVEKSLSIRKNNGNIYKWSEDELKDIQSYRRSVSYYTEKTYEKYRHIINPNGLERGIHTNHIDHIFPVIEGWRNKIEPKLISHYKNLRLVDSYDNLSKGERTDFLVDDFFKLIK